MGNIQSVLTKKLSSLFSVFKGNKKASMAILGLDSAGKSTLVNLFRDTNIPTVPTLGFNVEEVIICNTTIKIWDVGGQKEFIAYWSEYVRGINGLVFVIDVADEDRFQASFEGFKTLVSHLSNRLPILLLLNKVDLIESDNVINRRIEAVKQLYNTDNRENGINSYIKIDQKIFKNHVMPVSVKNDLNKMSSMGSSWSIQDSTVFSGFKWLIDEMKSAEPIID